MSNKLVHKGLALLNSGRSRSSGSASGASGQAKHGSGASSKRKRRKKRQILVTDTDGEAKSITKRLARLKEKEATDHTADNVYYLTNQHVDASAVMSKVIAQQKAPDMLMLDDGTDSEEEYAKWSVFAEPDKASKGKSKKKRTFAKKGRNASSKKNKRKG